MKILVINGPNLNLLGERETNNYGEVTLESINAELTALANELNVEIDFFQSNTEGAIVDKIQSAKGESNNTFKPKINEKSTKIFKAFMDRVINEEMEDPNKTEKSEKSEVKRDPHMEYIERLLLKSKKKEAQKEKLKEELHVTEDKECTFKPKLYSNKKISKAYLNFYQ